jgi:capsular polysaccharide transport system permease protein
MDNGDDIRRTIFDLIPKADDAAAGDSATAPRRPGQEQGGASTPSRGDRLRGQPGPARQRMPAFGDGGEVRDSVTIPRLPVAAGSLSKGALLWLAISVGLPVLAAALYYTFLAADQFSTELRYSVRGEDSGYSYIGTGAPVLNPGTINTGVSASAGSASPGIDVIDNYTVQDYIGSAQAVADVGKVVDLRKIFGSPAADWWSRLGSNRPREVLQRYWRGMVYSTFDPATGLGFVRVRAYSPDDAYAIANALSASISEVVSHIGADAREKAVEVAQHEVDLAQQEVLDLNEQARLLREKEKVIDPSSSNSVVAGNVAMANSLRMNLSQIEANIAALSHQLNNANAPEILVLKAQLEATQKQLSEADGRISSNLRGDSGLAGVIAAFEKLDIQRQSAEQLLLGNLANLQEARAQVSALHLYVSFYQKPMRPESSTYPRRLMSIGIVVLGALMTWIIGLLLAKSVMDHAR